jgi:DNA-directed RNA polymerase specialized sigma24 family protein
MVVEIQTVRSPRRGRERTEVDVRALVRSGDEEGAATVALAAHEAEIFGFLVAALGSGPMARDVYGRVCERVRREIGDFGWRCALRTWMYAVCRVEIRRQPRHAATSAPRPPAPSADQAPTPTQRCQGSTMEEAIAALRDRLDVEDRALLILSVDRGLELPDLAITGLGEGAASGALRAEGTRIRGELTRIRHQLEQAAIEERLIEPR